MQMLADVGGVKVVGTASSRAKAVNVVAKTNPHIIVIADVGPAKQDTSGSLISLYPDIPIICADLNKDYVQVITSRRVSARREDLLVAIDELFKQPQQD